MQNLTPEFFNGLIIVVMLIGLVMAGIRFYRDMTRPLPPQINDYEEYLRRLQDDTQPHGEQQA